MDSYDGSDSDADDDDASKWWKDARADGFDCYDDHDSDSDADGYDERMLQNREGSFLLMMVEVDVNTGYDCYDGYDCYYDDASQWWKDVAEQRRQLCADADGFDGFDDSDSDSDGADGGYDERMLQNRGSGYKCRLPGSSHCCITCKMEQWMCTQLFVG